MSYYDYAMSYYSVMYDNVMYYDNVVLRFKMYCVLFCRTTILIVS